MYQVTRTATEGDSVTMVIGLQCRTVLGFLYMWTHILWFLIAVRRADGCIHSLAGISSPFSILMISYWESEKHLLRFVGHPSHVAWMRFTKKHPRALNLFNETYASPLRANHINAARGFAKAKTKTTQEEPRNRSTSA